MSESEEMYLISIARAVEDGLKAPIALSWLAERLSVQPVSVNQMVRKLEEGGLVSYQPYKGVSLTEPGWQIAEQVLRRRRLWAFFLEHHLELPADEADDLACRMEHITNAEVEARLAAYLEGQPAQLAGPLPPDLAIPPGQSRPLDELTVGQEAIVVELPESAGTAAFLEAQGLKPGAVVRLLAHGQAGALLLGLAGAQIRLAPEVAAEISVREAALATSPGTKDPT
jgi:DtxR family Mn-dependent transcriptional regulator